MMNENSVQISNELIEDFIFNEMKIEKNQDFSTSDFVNRFKEKYPTFRFSEIFKHLNSMTIDSPHTGAESIGVYLIRKSL
jgi:hypothetical protein